MVLKDQSESQIRAWVDSFDIDSELTGDVKRKYLAHFVNNGTTEDPKWEILGYKVEDASIEYNWEEETVTDIIGNTYRTITRSQPEINLEGYIVNRNSTFLKGLAKKAIRNAYDEFSQCQILTVFYWLIKGSGNEKKYLAKVEDNCTIQPDSLGGEGYVRVSPVITLSNKHYFGSVNKGVGVVTDMTFTPFVDTDVPDLKVSSEKGTASGDTLIKVEYTGSGDIYYKKGTIIPPSGSIIEVGDSGYTKMNKASDGDNNFEANVTGTKAEDKFIVVAANTDRVVLIGKLVNADPKA